MTRVLLQLLIVAGVLSSISILTTNTYAEICDINCEAPTIGVINNGQRIVKDGLMINDRTFTVEEHIQSIPTMTLITGNTAKIKLEVYEDNGVNAIRHVSVAISDYKDDRNQNELASIWLEQDFTGKQTVKVVDPNSIFKSATAQMIQTNQFRAMVEFSFKLMKPFDKSSLITYMWDDGRAARTNVFLDAVQGTGNEIIEYVPILSKSMIPAPLKQVTSGVAIQDVECREGLELVIRTTGAPACVYPFTAEILRSWGMIA